MRKNAKSKNNEPQKWQILGFTDKYHYQNWLYFNGLVDEVHTYDNVWYDEYSGSVVSLCGEEEDSSDADEEYVRSLLEGRVVDTE